MPLKDESVEVTISDSVMYCVEVTISDSVFMYKSRLGSKILKNSVVWHYTLQWLEDFDLIQHVHHITVNEALYSKASY